MNIKEISSNSFSFIGDSVYTLKVREYFIDKHYQSSKKLQQLTNKYNCAKGQAKVYTILKENNFFTEEEDAIFKRGRNHITHIPKNGDLDSYATASGLEAIVGYLYYTDKKRLDDLFIEIFKVGLENE